MTEDVRRATTATVICAVLLVVSSIAMTVYEHIDGTLSNRSASSPNSPWGARSVPMTIAGHPFDLSLVDSYIYVYPAASGYVSGFRNGSQGKAKHIWRLSDQGQRPIPLFSVEVRMDRKCGRKAIIEQRSSLPLCEGYDKTNFSQFVLSDTSLAPDEFYLDDSHSKDKFADDPYVLVKEGRGVDWFRAPGRRFWESEGRSTWARGVVSRFEIGLEENTFPDQPYKIFTSCGFDYERAPGTKGFQCGILRTKLSRDVGLSISADMILNERNGLSDVAIAFANGRSAATKLLPSLLEESK